MHPYSGLPATSYWRKSVSDRLPEEIDLRSADGFRIGSDARIATAGSCFAQRIARHLQDNGYNYFRAEPAPANDAGNPYYEMFSAAYGNIYTTTQLRQLMLRAYGLFEPEIKVWRTDNGSYIDPFRPTLKDGGYSTPEQVLGLQEDHLAAVRHVFEDASVFIFTLGMTETWMGRDGGAVPLAPGVVNANRHGDDYTFVNLTSARVSADLLAFVDDLTRLNRKVEVILTVSPVPMIATYENRHVVVSNMYSKSVLRVAAGELAQARGERVHYFPSYEMIMGHQARAAFFGSDLREVTPEGVCHVMAKFSQQFLETDVSTGTPENAHDIGSSRAVSPPARTSSSAFDQLLKEYSAVAAVVCDEERLVNT